MVSAAKRAESDLLAYALSLPQAVLETPWGHDVPKVRGKMFAIFGGREGPADRMTLTVKLPLSADMALTLPYATRASHGLGKAGWVRFELGDGDEIDMAMFEGFLRQSWRAVTPKKMAGLLPEPGA